MQVSQRLGVHEKRRYLLLAAQITSKRVMRESKGPENEGRLLIL
jgi:hypothetical protein